MENLSNLNNSSNNLITKVLNEKDLLVELQIEKERTMAKLLKNLPEKNISKSVISQLQSFQEKNNEMSSKSTELLYPMITYLIFKQEEKDLLSQPFVIDLPENFFQKLKSILFSQSNFFSENINLSNFQIQQTIRNFELKTYLSILDNIENYPNNKDFNNFFITIRPDLYKEWIDYLDSKKMVKELEEKHLSNQIIKILIDLKELLIESYDELKLMREFENKFIQKTDDHKENIKTDDHKENIKKAALPTNIIEDTNDTKGEIQNNQISQESVNLQKIIEDLKTENQNLINELNVTSQKNNQSHQKILKMQENINHLKEQLEIANEKILGYEQKLEITVKDEQNL